MLQRIISIKNIGRFRNCAAQGDVTFRRYTLMFAENARGKTTLCAILRSLFTNAPALILGRATLGTVDPPEVQLLTSTGTVIFGNGAWNAAYPNIGVFDATYISENVYAGDAVDTEHRRNLYRVIIGAQGVALAAILNALEDLIKTTNNEIRDNRTRVQQYIAPGMTVQDFIDLAEDPEIEAKIAAKEQDLQAVRQAAQLQQKAVLTALKVPVFPASFAQLLAKTFDNVAVDAERHVSEHIAQHRMGGRGEAWLNEGLQYIAQDACPFCNRALAGVTLIQDFTSFFSREYHALRAEVNALKSQVDIAIGARVAAGFEQTVLLNASNAESWQQYCEVVTPALPEAGTIDDIMGALRDAAQALLDVKAGTPLDPVAPDERFTQALSSFEALRTSFGAYNDAVATANSVITARKRQAQVANLREVEMNLAKLKSQRARHEPEVCELCDTITLLQNNKTAIEGQKATARQELDTHTQRVITQYGQRINWYLERINASFRITTPVHTYRGGPPSTSYQIVINGNSVDLGDPESPLDRPSFKNTLSGGDRSTLALAFFFAQLEQDGNRATKVVVFDDPFASMDSFRRNHTVHQIFRSGETCAQVIVLSHDPQFLHLMWERVAAGDRKALWMARVGEENTTIVEWDIERSVQARYRADIDTIQRFFSLGEGDRMDVIQKLRPVLEAYCRTLYPTQFGEQEMMGSITKKIRGAGAAHPLSTVVDDLDELNMYCRRYHHGENPNAATEPIDDAELQGYVKRTLKLVGCLL